MNTTKARTRLLFLAREVRVEAQHWKCDPPQFGYLVGLALHLGYLSRTINEQPGPIVQAGVDLALAVVVKLATSRSLGAVQTHG